MPSGGKLRCTDFCTANIKYQTGERLAINPIHPASLLIIVRLCDSVSLDSFSVRITPRYGKVVRTKALSRGRNSGKYLHPPAALAAFSADIPYCTSTQVLLVQNTHQAKFAPSSEISMLHSLIHITKLKCKETCSPLPHGAPSANRSPVP